MESRRWSTEVVVVVVVVVRPLELHHGRDVLGETSSTKFPLKADSLKCLDAIEVHVRVLSFPI